MPGELGNYPGYSFLVLEYLFGENELVMDHFKRCILS